MSIKFTKLGSILLITAISSLFTLQAQAEEMEQPLSMTEQPLSTLEVFEKAFFKHTENAFDNDSMVNQLNTIFGFNLFPETQISLDGELVHMLYVDVMKKQAQGAAPVKTRDLSNPYSTSLQQNPEYIGY